MNPRMLLGSVLRSMGQILLRWSERIQPIPDNAAAASNDPGEPKETETPDGIPKHWADRVRHVAPQLLHPNPKAVPPMKASVPSVPSPMAETATIPEAPTANGPEPASHADRQLLVAEAPRAAHESDSVVHHVPPDPGVPEAEYAKPPMDPGKTSAADAPLESRPNSVTARPARENLQSSDAEADETRWAKPACEPEEMRKDEAKPRPQTPIYAARPLISAPANAFEPAVPNLQEEGDRESEQAVLLESLGKVITYRWPEPVFPDVESVQFSQDISQQSTPAAKSVKRSEAEQQGSHLQAHVLTTVPAKSAQTSLPLALTDNAPVILIDGQVAPARDSPSYATEPASFAVEPASFAVESDRWPSLPDSTEPELPDDWAAMMKERKRLLRLDREQRGTLWNE